MTGIDRAGRAAIEAPAATGPEFPPALDLVPVAIGVVGLVAGALDAGGNPAVSLLRTFAGAAFLGSITDAMLLGHWYLVQPGLERTALLELVRWVRNLCFVEVALLLVPIGMISVFNGSIDDGYNGILGWTNPTRTVPRALMPASVTGPSDATGAAAIRAGSSASRLLMP